MVFSSVIFLFFFLPFVLLVNAALPRRAQNAFLLLASLLFYAWGEFQYTALLLASLGMNYLFGLGLTRSRSTEQRKAVLTAAIALNLGLLLAFRYAGFLIDTLNTGLAAMAVRPVTWRPLHAPIGISFITFHALSYVIDVYRGQTPAQRHPTRLGLYLAFFPKLIAGPITRYTSFAAQLVERRTDVQRLASGVQRFIVGLAKKLILANSLSVTADWAFALPAGELTLSAAWVGIVCYTLQIYFDFSGYSDMAIGVGRILGFELPENFNYPYVSRSIREFWRRWHITLGAWFRDYLYLPLGGNRRSPARTYLNLVIVFFLCGLWHGAAWTFILWGLLHGALLALERTRFGRLLARLPAAISHLYVLLAISIGWVFFRAESLAAAWHYLACMFGFSTAAEVCFDVWSHMDVERWVMIALSLLGSLPWLPRLRAMMLRKGTADPGSTSAMHWAPGILGLVGLIALLLLSAIQLAGSTHNPFIYFKF